MEGRIRVAVLTEQSFCASTVYDQTESAGFKSLSFPRTVKEFRSHRSFNDLLHTACTLGEIAYPEEQDLYLSRRDRPKSRSEDADGFLKTLSACEFFVPERNTKPAARVFSDAFDAVFLFLQGSMGTSRLALPLLNLLGSDLLPPLFIFNLDVRDLHYAENPDLLKSVLSRARLISCCDDTSFELISEKKILPDFRGELVTGFDAMQLFGFRRVLRSAFEFKPRFSCLLHSNEKADVLFSSELMLCNAALGFDLCSTVIIMRLLCSFPECRLSLVLNSALYSRLDALESHDVPLYADAPSRSHELSDAVRVSLFSDLCKTMRVALADPEIFSGCFDSSELALLQRIAADPDLLLNRVSLFARISDAMSDKSFDLAFSTKLDDVLRLESLGVPVMYMSVGPDRELSIIELLLRHDRLLRSLIEAFSPLGVESPELLEFTVGNFKTMFGQRRSFLLSEISRQPRFTAERLLCPVSRSSEWGCASISLAEIVNGLCETPNQDECRSRRARLLSAVNSALASVRGAKNAAEDPIMRTAQLSNFTYAGRYGMHFSLLRYFVSKIPELQIRFAAKQLSVLSFGCSRGDEVFDLMRYFEEQSITGADISKAAINIALSQLESCDRDVEGRAIFANHAARLRFLTSEQLLAAVRSGERFDVITAMTVLCRHPDTMGLDNANAVYPFSSFESVLHELHKMLHLGGLLCVFNANYRLEDTSLASKYVPLYPHQSAEDLAELAGIDPESVVPDERMKLQEKNENPLSLFGHTALFNADGSALISRAGVSRASAADIIFIKVAE